MGKSKNSRSVNTVKNTAAGIAARIVTIILGFVMRTVFIKTLGIQYTAVSSLFTDILTVLSFAELGIHTAIIYALYKPVAQKDYQRTASLMDFYKKAYRIIALIVFVCGVAVIPFLGYIVKDVPDITEDIRIIYFLYIVNTSTSYLWVYRATLLTAYQKHRVVSRMDLVISIVRAVIEAGVLFLLKNFFVYLVFGVSITITRNIIVSAIAKKTCPELRIKNPKPISKTERKSMLKDVFALALYKISHVILGGTDSIVISSCINTSIVGVLSNYRMVTKQIGNLVVQFYRSASPSIGNLASTSSDEKQYRTFKTLFFIAFWISCFSCVSFITLLDPFIYLWFQKESLVFASPIVVLSITMEFFSTSLLVPVSSFRNTNGLFVQGKWRPAIMAAMNIALSFGLAVWLGQYGAEYGVAGVKFATVISVLSTQAWYDPYIVYKNVFHQPMSKYLKTYGKYILITAVSCFGTYALAHWVISFENKYVEFVFQMGCCVLVPNLLIFLLFRNTQEFKDFMQFLKSIIFKRRMKAAKAVKTAAAVSGADISAEGALPLEQPAQCELSGDSESDRADLTQ